MSRNFLEGRELTDDLKRFADLLADGAGDGGSAPGECSPPFDVVETTGGIEVVMDLPGVSASALRVVFARNTLVVAGQKRPSGCEHRQAAFHLAERMFGRFARAVRLSGAFDAGHATATLAAGELRVVLPRIEERRGAEIQIPIRID